MNKPCLVIKDLTIAFGGIKAVDHLNFHINEGEIYGLIGPNGAGKTTAFNCITQFYKPNKGSVMFVDKEDNLCNLVELKTHQIIKKGLVRTFQNVELIGELSILENLLVGAHIDFRTGVLYHALRTRKARREERELLEKATEICKFLGLSDTMNDLIGGQPYGVLKKVELGRTLMSNPKLIILDEPAAGLNDTETVELAKLLKEIRNTYKCTILLVEHDMRLIMDVCDRICAISFGKKLAEGSPEEIQNDLSVQEAYLGKVDEDEQDAYIR